MSPRSTLNRSYLVDFAVMAVVTGFIASLYEYSFGNVEQFPLILRQIDGSFLERDFFLNAFDTYGPRFYYARLIAALSSIAPLYMVLPVLLVLVNSVAAFVSCLAGWWLFDRSRFAGLMVCAVVMSVHTFVLGYKPEIVFSKLIPSGMTVPLVLISVIYGLRYRPLASALAAAVATPFHPLFGLETGAVMFATQVIATALPGSRRRIAPARLAGAAGILAAAAFVWMWPYRSAEHIPLQQFVDIISFRAPHHYLPGSFPPEEYLGALLFVVAGALSWWQWRRSSQAAAELSRPVVVLVAILLLLCAGGYVFVEIVPVRLWIVAQTFRLLFLLKWLGLVLMAGVVARALESSREGDRKEHVMLAAILTPVTAAFTNAWIVVTQWMRSRGRALGGGTGLGVAMLLVMLALIVFGVSPRCVMLLAVFATLAWLSRSGSRLVFLGALIVTGVGYAGVSYTAHALNLSSRGLGVVARLDPLLTVDDLDDDYSDAARYVKANTPGDAVLLVPPKRGGWMRVVGERAIVVDFSCFPFDEPAMIQWRERIAACYGTTSKGGWPAARDLDRNYRAVTLDHIRGLSSRYGVTHAVVYRETSLDAPALYENATYKIVAVDG